MTRYWRIVATDATRVGQALRGFDTETDRPSDSTGPGTQSAIHDCLVLQLPVATRNPAPQIRCHDFWRYINSYVCVYGMHK